MPLLEKDAAKLAAAAEARQEKREARGKAVKEGAEVITPIAQSKMLNLPIDVDVHGLKLTLTCPKFGESLRIQEKIFSEWPSLVLYSASGNVKGKGLEPESLLDNWNMNLRAGWEAAKVDDPETPEPPTVTVDDLQAALRQTVLSIDDALPAVCDCLSAFAATSAGIQWPKSDVTLPPGKEWLDDAIKARFHVAELCDLLRILLDVMGGFPGDVSERFLSSVSGEATG